MPNDGRLTEIVTYRPAAREGQNAQRHAECVRLLRNEVRENLTRTSEEITNFAQWQWWNSVDALKRYIVIVDIATVDEPDPTFAGFGMIHPIDGHGWLTGALRSQYRGKGHGRALFDHLIRQCQALGIEPWLEVFRDNLPALRLYETLGFQWERELDVRGRRIMVGRHTRAR